MYWCGSDTIVVVCKTRKEGCIRRLLLRLLIITSTLRSLLNSICTGQWSQLSFPQWSLLYRIFVFWLSICFVLIIYLTVREHSGQYINRHVHGVLCFKFPCYASDHRQVLRRFNHAKPNYGISLSVKLISTFRNQVLGYFWPIYYCAE